MAIKKRVPSNEQSTTTTTPQSKWLQPLRCVGLKSTLRCKCSTEKMGGIIIALIRVIWGRRRRRHICQFRKFEFFHLPACVLRQAVQGSHLPVGCGKKDFPPKQAGSKERDDGNVAATAVAVTCAYHSHNKTTRLLCVEIFPSFNLVLVFSNGMEMVFSFELLLFFMERNPLKKAGCASRGKIRKRFSGKWASVFRLKMVKVGNRRVFRFKNSLKTFNGNRNRVRTTLLGLAKMTWRPTGQEF